jgi:hypothetical protein
MKMKQMSPSRPLKKCPSDLEEGDVEIRPQKGVNETYRAPRLGRRLEASRIDETQSSAL